MVGCNVPGCKSRSDKLGKFNGITFHRFPRDPVMKAKWIQAVRNGRGWKPREYSKVCSLHFKKDLIFLKDKRKRVRAHAIPTENLPPTICKKEKIEQSIKNEHGKISNATDSPCNIKMGDIKGGSFMLNEKTECRTCLQMCFGGNLIDMYQTWSSGKDPTGVTVADELCRITQVEIRPEDPHSRFICLLCLKRLQDACMFVRNVHDCNMVLESRMRSLINGDNWPKPIEVHKNVDSVVLGVEPFVEIKQEIPSEDEMDSEELSTEPIQMMDIKVEPEEIVEPRVEYSMSFCNDSSRDSANNNTVDTNVNEVTEIEDEINLSPISPGSKRATKDLKDLMPFKITVNGTIPEDQYQSIPVMTIHGDILDRKNNEEVKVKPEPSSDDEELTSGLSLDCMLCMKSFNNMADLKVHVIAKHSYLWINRKHVCSFCRKNFTTSTDLMVHETCHNKHSCYGCNNKFDTFAQLSDHTEKCPVVIANRSNKLKTLADVTRKQSDLPILEKCLSDHSKSDVNVKQNNKVNTEIEVSVNINSFTKDQSVKLKRNSVTSKNVLKK